MDLTHTQQLIVVQRKELAELFGFETRNKYEIFNDQNLKIGFVAEGQKGLLSFLFRQLFGHWRSFEVYFYNINREQVLIANHPFKFLFQEFHVYDQNKNKLGYAKQRFGIWTKKFDVYNNRDELILRMRSGLFKIWSFPLKNPQGEEVALIQKKWGGIFKELFLDSDSFKVIFNSPVISQNERSIILALSVFTDLQYFEHKAD